MDIVQSLDTAAVCAIEQNYFFNLHLIRQAHFPPVRPIKVTISMGHGAMVINSAGITVYSPTGKAAVIRS